MTQEVTAIPGPITLVRPPGGKAPPRSATRLFRTARPGQRSAAANLAMLHAWDRKAQHNQRKR